MRYGTILIILLLLTACQPEVAFEESASGDFFSQPAAETPIAPTISAITLASSSATPTPAPPPTRTPWVTQPPPPPPPTPTYLANGCELYLGWMIRDVQAGETLFSIAAAYELTPYDLQRANCLGDAQSFAAGQKVAVPAEIFPTTHTSPNSVTVYPADQCDAHPFAPRSGLAVGVTGTAITYGAGQHVEIWSEPTGFISYFGLLGGDTFTVLEGPVCFKMGTDGLAGQSRRRWQVRTTLSQIEGWVDEYVGDAAQFLHVTAPVGQTLSPVIESFAVSPLNPAIDDTITITWVTRNSSGVSLTGGGIDMPPHSPRWTQHIAASSLIVDDNGCVTLTITARGSTENVSAEQQICISTDPQAGACPFPRLTTDPTLPPDCPAAMPQTASAVLQFYENGLMIWFDGAGQNGQPTLLVVFDDGTALTPPPSYFIGQTPPPIERPIGKPISPSKEMAYAWVNYPNLKDRIGWPVSPEYYYNTTWQIIAGHVVLVWPDGQQSRYLIYDGDYGVIVPIAPQRIP